MSVSLTPIYIHADNQCSSRDEIVTPHQTTLLKLVDSYLQANQVQPTSTDPPVILHTHETIGSFMAKRLFVLSEYAQRAMQRSLGMVPPPRHVDVSNDHATERTSSDSASSSEPSPIWSPSEQTSAASSPFPQELDVMLPKVCEALVLVAQCIVTVALEAEEQQARINEGSSTYTSFTNMKNYYVQKRYEGVGLVESLIGMSFPTSRVPIPKLKKREITELLHLLDIFLPRIQFGKPVNPDGTPVSSLSPPVADGSGFSYLKRDLVRLLGVLAHGVKDVQDRVREVGGLPVVMNLCVVDERNPCEQSAIILTFDSNINL